MRQVVQVIGDGWLKVVDVPTPTCGPTEVLVATTRSLVSTGTERAVRSLASASLWHKAKARPDLVRQVVQKARTEGLRATIGAVRTKLDDEMALGYSGAGVVQVVGSAVSGLQPGMRVATASAGHAEAQVVPGLLAVPIPEGVTDEEAAFGAVAAIAMQGLRQADVGLGGTVVVVGLGLIGQLTVRLALAAGLGVIGVDLRATSVARARAAGAEAFVESGADTTEAIRQLTRGRGADAVLITASTPSSDPVMTAVDRVRDRGTVVVVGDIGLELARTPFYLKEIDLRFARSYEPGRYDRTYEEYAVDYPLGAVRWTEGRNIEAFLDLVATGRLEVADLVTHTFDIGEAQRAYDVIAAEPEALAIQFSYPGRLEPHRSIALHEAAPTQIPGLGIIGAGNYAKATFLPAMKAAGLTQLRAVTSASGLTARHLGERHGIAAVEATVDSLIGREDIGTVFVLSRHDSHAEITQQALRAGKNVFVEKPLALSEDELDGVLEALSASGRQLSVGFNRRHSEAVRRARAALSTGPGPVVVTYRVNAGRLPESHWYKDRRQGGRLLGEVCHFMDLAAWLIGRPAVSVTAAGGGHGERLLTEDVSVLMAFEDGSSAVVSYAENGHPATAKERVEVLGRGHSIVIDDYRSLTIDGASVKLTSAGKGHVDNLRRFAGVLAVGNDLPDTRASITSTAAALAAARSLETGETVRVDQRVGAEPFEAGP